jgi:RNA polymerase sigma factor (TIGR02999 family)
VDHARRGQSEKRGGGQIRFSLDERDAPVVDRDERLLEMDQALARLELLDVRAGKVVELRYFGGLSEKEAAEALGISVATLKRDWDFARTWLAQLM